MKKFLIINGVNLNMLGVREPEIYGNNTLASLEEQIKSKAGSLLAMSIFFRATMRARFAMRYRRRLGYMTV